MWPERQAPERFSCALPFRSGHFEKVASQRGQLKTVQNSPLASRLAGFFNDGAVDNPEQSHRLVCGQRNPILAQ
jgi:hypothetical protein